MNKKLFLDYSLKELESLLSEMGEPPYRTQQIWKHAYQDLLPDPAGMTSLPSTLRRRLEEAMAFESLQMERALESHDRKTWKYLFRTREGAPLETVHMSYDQRETACISTQSGCGMGCVFCATGTMGLRRSLSSGEIAAQVLFLSRKLLQKRKRLTNIVYMGMGEPFSNYDAMRESLLLLMHPDGFRFGARRMTISTVGLVPGILRFSEEPWQVNLAISLHAAEDSLREKLIPINSKYPIKEIFNACEVYIQKTHRRVSLEWALMHGINDSPDQAKKLVRLISAMPRPLFHVNLIPWNPIPGFTGDPASPNRMVDFRIILENHNIPCTVRVRRGLDIAAGCGQLASKTE